jgi:hypothetical protein
VRQYKKLLLIEWIRDIDPASEAQPNGYQLPYLYSLQTPAYEIVRAPGEPVYLVKHVASGVWAEVPVERVRQAYAADGEAWPVAPVATPTLASVAEAKAKKGGRS